MADAKNIAIEIIGIPIFIIGILTIFTDWPFTKIAAISFACGLIITIAHLLTSISEQSTTSDQQSKAPTTTTSRKFPVKTIVAVIIGIVILALIFSGTVKIGTVVEKGKVMAAGKPEIPVLTDDFSRQELGENWQLGTGKWQIENGKLVGKNTGLDAWIHLKPVFEADKITITFDAWIESKEWKPKTEIGCYFYDEGNENDYYPILLFDGQANIFDKTDNPLWQPFATGMLRSNKIYRIKATRNQQQEKVCLSLVVSGENGKIIANDDKTINSGRERVKIGFFSFNVINHSEGSADKIHIDNLKIYAYTTT